MAVFTLKPLKITAKEANDPVEFFLKNGGKESGSLREVCFYRLVGINCDDAEYIGGIQNIDKILQTEKTHIPYLRLDSLAGLPAAGEAEKYAAIYDGWVPLKNETKKRQFEYALSFTFQDEIMELTLKEAFLKILTVYETNTKNVTPSMVRNFGVRILHWTGIYLPQIFKETEKKISIFPKILFTGSAKKTESLFLYFLSLLGCDLLYMNTAADLPDFYQEVTKCSNFCHCGVLRELAMPLPHFTAAAEAAALPAVAAKAAESRNTVLKPAEIQQTAVTADRELSYEELAQRSASVVMIKIYDENKEVCGSGSGVVLTETGLILTNHHVIRGGSSFVVQFENDIVPYPTDYIVKYNYNYDLAIIKVDKTCAPLPLLQDAKLARGQKIVSIGSPLGLFNTVSDGIISGFREFEHTTMIQHTAASSPGSSGGALLDLRGRLVGLLQGGYREGENLNLAVDAATILKFVANFIK
ncbi:MAG: trypsin-like peptidase domain-containing protein [Sporomusaceae bacterium]|jgi:S1-C subfamily serine protease|nr:trypsin-like peptidase domain-containing protein [Sporomusaceae bacterium]